MTMTQMLFFLYSIFYAYINQERKNYYDKRLLLSTVSHLHIRNVVAFNWYEVGNNNDTAVRFNKYRKHEKWQAASNGNSANFEQIKLQFMRIQCVNEYQSCIHASTTVANNTTRNRSIQLETRLYMRSSI